MCVYIKLICDFMVVTVVKIICFEILFQGKKKNNNASQKKNWRYKKIKG